MNNLETVEIACPYCAEYIEVIIDCSVGDQKYIEDCEVCCRPITLDIKIGEDHYPIVNAMQQEEL